MSGKGPSWDRQRTIVLLALAAGLSRAAASAKAGIADRTLRRWCEEESFSEAVEVAMGEGRAVYEELLKKAGEKDWRAAYAAYEAIYLGGRRRDTASASATVVFANAAPTRELSDEEKEASFVRARDVVRILVRAVGPERTAEIIAAREQERLRALPPGTEGTSPPGGPET